MVPFGFRIACRRASWPTRRSPWGVKATTDGVVRAPSAFGITVGLPPSLTAITELVVPRSIPTAFAIVASSPVTAPRRERSAAINEQRSACTARHAERLARGTCPNGIIRRTPQADHTHPESGGGHFVPESAVEVEVVPPGLAGS